MTHREHGAEVQAAWAQLLIQTLHEAGVERFVVSPGSRSTPLVLALQALALPFSVVTDERSAGFLALGHSKRSGQPTALLCTSGSAAAHYFPALIEADESNTPLLIVSADRPPELQGNRSFQTIDQCELFGRKVRQFFDLGIPEGTEQAFLGLRRKAVQAVALARSPKPGPVHLNVPARKPLEPSKLSPTLAPGSDAWALLATVRSRPLTAYYAPEQGLNAAAATAAANVLAHATRPALVVGPGAPLSSALATAVAAFARSTGWPVLLEASSGVRFAAAFAETSSDAAAAATPPTAHAVLNWDAFDLCLRANAAHGANDLAPDALLQLGNVPTSDALSRLLGGVPRVVVCEYDWADPENTAACMLRVPPAAALNELARLLPAASTAWRNRVERANSLAWQAVAEICDAPLGVVKHSVVEHSGIKPSAVKHSVVEPDAIEASASEHSAAELAPGAEVFSHEGQAVVTLGRALSCGDLLVLGNSLPVRLVDTFIAARPVNLHCLSQRGANGIDGLLALAAGASLEHAKQSWLLVGDISFLHDVGSLKVLADLQPQLCVIVLNNCGGRLFEQLPVAETLAHDLAALEPWLTPHRFELWRIAASFGIASYRVGTQADLECALLRARERRSPSLIEVLAEPSGTRLAYRRLVARTQALLGTTA